MKSEPLEMSPTPPPPLPLIIIQTLFSPQHLPGSHTWRFPVVCFHLIIQPHGPCNLSATTSTPTATRPSYCAPSSIEGWLLRVACGWCLWWQLRYGPSPAPCKVMAPFKGRKHTPRPPPPAPLPNPIDPSLLVRMTSYYHFGVVSGPRMKSKVCLEYPALHRRLLLAIVF